MFFYGIAHYIDLSSNVSKETLQELTTVLDGSTFSIIVIMCVFWLLYWLNLVPIDKLYSFIDLPEQKEKLTFPALSTYCGEQAFGSFFATILITYAKPIYQSFGILAVSLYTALISLSMLSFCAVSLMRFVYLFTDRKLHQFFLLGIVSLVFMGAMIVFGLKVGEAQI